MTRSDPNPAGDRHGVLVRAARADDLDAIARIYNQGIRDRVATFETREREPDELRPWLDDGAHPLRVAVDARAQTERGQPADEGPLLGWVAASSYRPRPCYAGIAEFSIYVAREARGRGVGHTLMAAFLPACAEAGLWKVLSRVFPENRASLRLLAAHGFREVGVYERHAKLDGAWRDVVIVERLLGEALRDRDQDSSASGSPSSPPPS